MVSTTVKQQTQLSTKRSETFLNGDVAGRFFCFWRMSDVLRASAETNRVTDAVTPRKAVQRKNSLFQLLPKEMQTSIREQKHENAAASREIKTNKGDYCGSVRVFSGCSERTSVQPPGKQKIFLQGGDSCCHPKTGFFSLYCIMKKHKMQNLRRKVHKFTD